MVAARRCSWRPPRVRDHVDLDVDLVVDLDVNLNVEVNGQTLTLRTSRGAGSSACLPFAPSGYGCFLLAGDRQGDAPKSTFTFTSRSTTTSRSTSTRGFSLEVTVGIWPNFRRAALVLARHPQDRADVRLAIELVEDEMRDVRAAHDAATGRHVTVR